MKSVKVAKFVFIFIYSCGFLFKSERCATETGERKPLLGETPPLLPTETANIVNKIQNSIIVLPKHVCIEHKIPEGTYYAMQNLLQGFNKEKMTIVDLKIGWRTFREGPDTDGDHKKLEDVVKKMGISEEELRQFLHVASKFEELPKEFSKRDRLNIRDMMTSSRTLGFRFSATKVSPEDVQTKLYSRLKEEDHVLEKLDGLLNVCIGEKSVKEMLIKKLEKMLEKIEKSEFFRTHEIIGSSILIVFDNTHIGVWLIDFGQTVELTDVTIDHIKPWIPGSHEDGYIAGLRNLIKLLKHGYVHKAPGTGGHDKPKNLLKLCVIL
ncbi:inositol polyphosphate kinase domain-containing protein [Ditylenchus destructor]|nr:inositol polyphosphate kinase domain-containing protein [Ditylenchus destructor]